jgi:DNA-binding NarL/FixJ family response regulator
MHEGEDSLPRAAVVLDPHPLCHEGLRSLLAPLRIDVVGACQSPATALDLLREREPDVFVAEVEGPEGPADGVQCIRAARERHPDLAIVVVSARVEAPVVEAALAAGATRYLAKTARPEEITDEIRRALAPTIYLVSEAGTPLPDGDSISGPRPIRVATPAGGVARLTRRELEVLRLVEGRSNRQVAQVLWVTDETVKFHLANIYRKLGVSSRAEAVAWARMNGLLESAGEDAYSSLAGARVPIAGAWGS